jgi:hypothetical protein
MQKNDKLKHIGHEKTRGLYSAAGLSKSFCAFSSVCQRRKHVRQPATCVVVMPVVTVAVNIGPKHCEPLITDRDLACQI